MAEKIKNTKKENENKLKELKIELLKTTNKKENH